MTFTVSNNYFEQNAATATSSQIMQVIYTGLKRNFKFNRYSIFACSASKINQLQSASRNRNFGTNFNRVDLSTEDDAQTDDFVPTKFKSYFEDKSPSLYDVKEGGYVDISNDTISKNFPEGLAGEMNDEFEFSGTKTWMIRDSTKVLCKLIDEYDQLKNRTSSVDNAESLTMVNSNNKPSAVQSNISLNGLTDRDPWRNTIMQAQYYGEEVIERVEAFKKLRGKPPVQEFRGNLISKHIDKIKQVHKGEIPTKILIAGKMFRVT